MLTPEPSRLLVVGDTHHDYRWFAHVAHQARHLGVDAVVQVGDFGYFPGTGFGDQFLTAATKLLDGHPELPAWYVLDGNHDNIPALEALERDTGGFGILSPRLSYIPRGHRWTWSQTTFAALGGAVSVDAARRSEGYNWWREEQVTYRQATQTIDGGTVDVLFTHDSGHGPWLPGHYKSDLVSTGHRATIDAVLAELTPKLQFHGHYHLAHDTTVETAAGAHTRVVGLGMNEDPTAGDTGQSYRVLELPSLTLT